MPRSSDMELDLGTILISFLALVVVIVLLSGIRVVREWERLPVLRLGRFMGFRGPGITYVIPFIEQVPQLISTRLDTIAIRSEQTLTKDNVPVVVDAVLYYKPVDLEKCVLSVEDYVAATMWAAQTTLREVIGKVELNELLIEREKVGAHLRDIIDEKTEQWGVKVVSVEVKDVVIPRELQEAMSRQAQAERERVARVTLAKAEFEAARTFLEAAREYEKDPSALTLRWMNILYELGRSGENNTIIFVPSELPMANIGILGFRPEKGREKKEE